MMSRNGAQLAARSFNKESVAGKGFFSLFYQWSRTECHAAGDGRGKVGKRFSSSHSHRTGKFRKPLVAHSICRKQSGSASIPHTLSEPLRHLMRSLPAPIVVLTTTLPSTVSPQSQKPQYRGMTLSSFTTLTLTPEPIITFNIRSTPTEPSRTLAALEENKNFLVHLLEDTPEGARIAQGFTRGNEGNVFGTTKANVEEETAEDGLVLPRLLGSGIRRVLRCKVLEENNLADRTEILQNSSGLIRVGDHVLVIARVLDILGSKPDSNVDVGEGFGLSYADGKYRRAGESIDPMDNTRA